ncbi:MAG: phosphatase PAP2 family protein [Thermoanaerobaculia bacterium]
MRVRPLEALNFGVLLVLSVLALVFYRALPDPGEILLRFALMGAFLALMDFLSRRAERLPPAIRVVVDFYPTAFIPFVFESLGPLIAAARGQARDDLLIAADRALFGTDVTVWLERFVRPWLTDLFYLFYSTYYFIGLALGAALWRRDHAEARRFIFTMSFCYFVSYVGYFALPALGPRFALASEQRVVLETTPLSRAVSTTINQLERTKLDVFPSGHTMIAAGVLLVAFRRARRAFWILLPVVIGLVVSTVYCRYHYVADVIAGLLLAVLAVPIGERIYDRAVGDPPAPGSRDFSYIR